MLFFVVASKTQIEQTAKGLGPIWIFSLQKHKECPDDLKEATSGLIFASSRCGKFPELLHIRKVLQSTFGKEFVARAVELRNNCGVRPKIIQKLSRLPPSLESKLKVLKEIASEKGITLNLESEQLDVDVSEKKDYGPIAKKSANCDDLNENLCEMLMLMQQQYLLNSQQLNPTTLIQMMKLQEQLLNSQEVNPTTLIQMMKILALSMINP
ncbi:hypothetical protein CCACVL1_12804 [Corchorus capsularis]|uniref:Uncharacterized protein n=1 Tax=Corchorus capsularis TaxID=210143 RepID=A0A1R3IDP6_COCAP|nr:hypothetical protein CCACVL1_12804 [Corchorus capsularis]